MSACYNSPLRRVSIQRAAAARCSGQVLVIVVAVRSQATTHACRTEPVAFGYALERGSETFAVVALVAVVAQEHAVFSVRQATDLAVGELARVVEHLLLCAILDRYALGLGQARRVAHNYERVDFPVAGTCVDILRLVGK